MTITVSPMTPVGELARAHPALLDLLDRLGLDYCCGGRDPLEEACRRADLDPDDVLAQVRAELARASAPGPADEDAGAGDVTTGMTALCDEIEATHHAFARSVFARLADLLPRIAAAHGNEHPGLRRLEGAVAALRDDMSDHMVREERVLFPWLRRLDTPGSIHVGPPWSVQRPIDCMVHDHDDVASAFARIRELTGGYAAPAGTCTSVTLAMRLLADLERDTRRHIHKENNILFPAGLEAERRRARPAPAVDAGAARCS